MALIGQCVATFFIVLFCSTSLSFLIGSCWMLMTFVEDIANEFSSLRRETKTSDGRTKTLKHQLSDIVQFYADVKQLSGHL